MHLPQGGADAPRMGASAVHPGAGVGFAADPGMVQLMVQIKGS